MVLLRLLSEQSGAVNPVSVMIGSGNSVEV